MITQIGSFCRFMKKISRGRDENNIGNLSKIGLYIQPYATYADLLKSWAS